MAINKTTQYTTDPNTIPVTTSTGTDQELANALDDRNNTVDSYRFVGDLVGLKALTGMSQDQKASIATTGRAGDFVFMGGDQSADVTGDPQEGIWVAPDSDATGASGAWKRNIPADILDPQWWGGMADGTSSTATRQAIQAAIDYAEANDRFRVYLKGGTWAIDDTLTKSQSFSAPVIQGDGFKYTRISYAFGVQDKPALLVKGGSGQDCGSFIEGIGFDGDSQSWGVEVQGQIGYVVRNCQFGLNSSGVIFHSFDTSEFTEYCVAEHCDFEQDCLTAVRYKRTNGNESFHGCGLRYCKINEKSDATTAAILIGGNCLPYNSPMDFQIWKRTAEPIIIHGGSDGANVHGQITIETFGSNVHKIVDGPTTLNWVGGFSSFGPYSTPGDVRFLTHVQVNSDRSTTYARTQFSKRYNLTTGDNDIPLGISQGEVVIVNTHIVATDYQFEDQLVIKRSTGGFASSGSLIEEHDFRSLNTAGYGAPTYTLVSGNTLRISNANYPASGVTAVVSITHTAARADIAFA